MSDEAADRLRGLGLVMQLVPALTFGGVASGLLRLIDLGADVFMLVLPPAVVLLQWLTGWVLVRRRQHARLFAIAYFVVAVSSTLMFLLKREVSAPLQLATSILEDVGWPLAILVAIWRGPRTPFAARHADLGGALLAYGLAMALIGAVAIVEIVRLSASIGVTEAWPILLWSSPTLAIVVGGVFALMAGVELAGPARPGRSRLRAYLVVSIVVAIAISGVSIAGAVINGRDRDSLAMQIATVVLGLSSLLAVPAVAWRYAANAKPLDVPDSAASVGVLRWTALFFALLMLARVARLLSRGVDTAEGVTTAMLAVQVAAAIAIFVTTNRRVAMWLAMVACVLAVAMVVVTWTARDQRLAFDALLPGITTASVFAALAWLNRPRARSERSLAAIFE